MRRILLLLLLLMLFHSAAFAQEYKEDVDTIWGKNYCPYVQGYMVGTGYDKTGTTYKNQLTSWPTFTISGEKYYATLVYYVLLPQGYVNGTAVMTTRGYTPNVHFRMINPVNGDTLIDKTFATEASTQNELNVVENYYVETEGWYRLEYEQDSESSRAIKTFSYTLFQRESDDAIVTPWIYSSLSSYMSGWSSTDPNAPAGSSYDWCYMEIYVPKEYECEDTYWSCMNLLGGYLGIQSCDRSTPFGTKNINKRTVIFSVWDSGDTATNPDLPEYLRSGVLDYDDPNLVVTRYDNEGSGTHTHVDNVWEGDNWVQLLYNCRPEDVEVTLTGSDGQDSVIVCHNTICSFWYKQANETEWHYESSIRRSGESNYVDAWSAFIENWSQYEGPYKRRAYYRNAYMRSIASGEWYHRNVVTGSKYDDASRYRSDKRDRRDDFNWGVGEDINPDMKNTFYMETGGFDQRNDWVNKTFTIPLSEDDTAADTISVDMLFERVKKAYITNKASDITELCGNGTLDELKAVAKDIIDNVNQFNYYRDEDIEELVKVYADGEVTDTAALHTAITKLSTTAYPLKYSTVQKLANIGTLRAYQLYSTKGYGIVCGTDNEESPLAVKQKVDVTDSLNNWILVRKEDTRKYYLYNIGLKKWLDLSKETLLSDSPKEVTVTANGAAFYLRQGTSYLGIAKDTTGIEAASKSNYCLFELRDNIMYQPSKEECEAIFASIDNSSNNQASDGLYVPSVRYSPESTWTADCMVFRATKELESAKSSNPKYRKVVGTPPADASGNAWYEPDYVLTPFDTSEQLYFNDDTDDPITVDNNGAWQTMTSPLDGWATENIPGDIYIRRAFKTTGDLNSVILTSGHDDSPSEWYINGTRVKRYVAGKNTDAAEVLSDDYAATIKTDGTDNVFAIHIHQNNESYYADGGLYGSASYAPMLYDHIGLWNCSYQFVDYENGTIADDWYTNSYTEDDSWIAGKGPFECHVYSNYAQGSTTWSNREQNDLYIRRHFTLTEEQAENIEMTWFIVSYDQDPVIYINGEQVFTASGWSSSFTDYTKSILSDIKLKAGDNVIACKAGHGSGGQFIDFGVYFSIRQGVTTGISALESDGTSRESGIVSDGKWYDLAGRRLNGKPTSKGIYINNGRKIVVK